MASQSELRYAGFWRRVSPAVFDFVVLGFALALFITFMAMAKGNPAAFLQLRPGDPPSAVIAAFGKPAIAAIAAFFILSSWLYFALLESSRWQATPGKKFFGLYVSDAQGNRLTFGRASRRFFFGRLLLCVPYVGGFYFNVDCLCAGVSPRKQAIHDMIADCLVLRKEEEPGLRRE